MKIDSVELLGKRWKPNAAALACTSLLVLQPPIFAVDAVPLLDAPGPGYREQSARLMKGDELPTLEPISFMYPFMAPKKSFDGSAPERPLLLREGEFKLLHENPAWNIRVFESDEAPLSQPAAAPEPAPSSSVPVPATDVSKPEGTSTSPDVIRLPVIPDVILPAPKEVNEVSEPARQPFVEILLLELRAR